MTVIPGKQVAVPMKPEASDDQKYGTGFIIAVLIAQQTLGGLTFPVAKFGLEFIEPFTFAFYRFALSSVVLLLIARLTRHAVPIEKKDYRKIIGLGVLIIPFNQAMYLVGQSLTGAGHGSLLFTTVPIWILIGALFHLKERPTARRVIGIIVAMVGVGFVMATGALQISTEYLWGDLIILVAVIAWASYTILGKPLVRKYGAIRVTAYSLAAGSLLYFPFGLFAAARVDYAAIPVSAWLSVVYVALGVSVGAYVLWYWALKYMEASRMAVFHNIQPLVAAGVAYLWLNEPLGWSFVIGGSIALIGVIIAEV